MIAAQHLLPLAHTHPAWGTVRRVERRMGLGDTHSFVEFARMPDRRGDDGGRLTFRNDELIEVMDR